MGTNSQFPIYWTINEAGDMLSSLSESRISGLLTQSELTQYKNFKILKRKREWLTGRLTAKALVASGKMPLAYIPFNQISIENLPEGAPSIASHQHIGSISISHRDNIAACAFIPDSAKSIGIDLELIEPRQLSFVEDFFTLKEVAFIKGLQADLLESYITLIWSAKEAILKVWQKGLRLDTRQVEIFPNFSAPYLERNDSWTPLAWKTNLEGYPDCWLGWRQWNDYMINLAVSRPGVTDSPVIPQIKEINTQDFFNTFLGV
jgi:4'-phosphopantetheinyl transferase